MYERDRERKIEYKEHACINEMMFSVRSCFFNELDSMSYCYESCSNCKLNI